MKFLICLVLFIAAAQAGVISPITTYSAGYTTYAAAPAYTAYSAALPAYTSSVYSAPAYTAYAAAPAVYSAPLTYAAPITTLLKK
ncbi:vitelline membrane protein Vm34Ca-like [Stomoxys calcitrans]|uniref:Cuticle protein 16.5-like n=1 Tax=Stomoxys calcitrans TaxID=35570 RepID=A0A1I8Q966_STOCA|nr:vitelline membrane protein Vm34Ca-like [Stomoxys calcitrans]